MHEQTQAWAGEFGNAYTDRNMGRVPANRAFFRTVLRAFEGAEKPQSFLELGCGAGENLKALRQLLPAADLAGIELNEKAVREAGAMDCATIYHGDILEEFGPWQHRAWDMTFTKGVLIHIAPADLERAYRALVRCSRRWVMIAEYYSPTPVEIDYRGRRGLLWKRDFAGELLTAFQELKLHSYGFVYHRDPYPQDDLTWMLLEKRQ